MSRIAGEPVLFVTRRHLILENNMSMKALTFPFIDGHEPKDGWPPSRIAEGGILSSGGHTRAQYESIALASRFRQHQMVTERPAPVYVHGPILEKNNKR